MADISDIANALVDIAVGAVYPDGTGQPSITGHGVQVFEGWPEPGAVDTAVSSSTTLVSVFPVAGDSESVTQVWESARVVVPPVHGMSAVVNGDTQFTLSGAPGLGEYATAEVNYGQRYSYPAVAGDTVASVATALAAMIAADHPGTAAVGGTVTIPGAFSLLVRIGAPAGMGQILVREAQLFQVSVWAPDPAARSLVAAAVDVAIKTNFRLVLPDTSQAVIRYRRTVVIDNEQNVGIYRRDLFYSVEYATIEQFKSYEVTSVGTTVAPIAPPPLI